MKQLKQTQKRLGSEISDNSLPFTVRAVSEQRVHYTVDVWDTIENLIDAEEAIFVLGIAEENDTVTINLNCRGGSADVGDAILMAMNRCEAPIHVVATGTVASMATFILLNADSFEISPYCSILCHAAIFCSGGEMQDTLEHTQFVYKQCEKFLREQYEGFFTDVELDRIINQKYQHWMDSEEFITRYNQRNEFLGEKMKEMLEKGDEDEQSGCGHESTCS
jgi:ATP-dependent protease ClpP protease subunit